MLHFFKRVLLTEACAWDSLDYFTKCRVDGERETDLEIERVRIVRKLV